MMIKTDFFTLETLERVARSEQDIPYQDQPEGNPGDEGDGDEIADQSYNGEDN